MPTDIALGPDGALWFTELPGNKIGRITTGGRLTEFAVPTPDSEPGGIALGPDSAIWFTEGFPKKIGRITTDGHIAALVRPKMAGLNTSGAAGRENC